MREREDTVDVEEDNTQTRKYQTNTEEETEKNSKESVVTEE